MIHKGLTRRPGIGVSGTLICVFLGFAFVAAPQYIETGDCDFGLGYIFASLVTAIFLCFVMAVFLKAFSKKAGDKPTSRFGLLIDRIFNAKHSVLLVGLVILACWAIPICMLYPGTAINDTWGQLFQYATGAYSAHHPVLDTLVMGGVIMTLKSLIGWHPAMFVYVILQAIATALSFSFAMVYADRKLCAGRRAVIAATLFISLIPVYPAAVQTISKDAFFSWLFILYFVAYLETIRTKGEVLRDWKRLVAFIAVIILCCLTKKVGIYVILLSLIPLPFVFRKRWLQLVFPILTCVCLVAVIVPAASAALHISPGGRQEMLSLPFQMTARYVTLRGDDVTSEEREAIDRVLEYDTIPERYNPTFADPIKGYSQRGTDEDYITYMKVWIKEGLRHPSTYIDATNAMISGWFSFCEYRPLLDMDFHSQLNDEIIPVAATERKLTADSSACFRSYYDNLYEIPVLNLPLSYAFYSSLIPAFALCALITRNGGQRELGLAILPILLSIVLGCWLAPASINVEGVRYLYPVVYTAPILLLWVRAVMAGTVRTNGDYLESDSTYVEGE